MSDLLSLPQRITPSAAPPPQAARAGVLPLLNTPEQLLDAVQRQGQMPILRIGEALIALGYIDDAQLKAALASQGSQRQRPLGELLVERGCISRADLQTALARKMGYPMVDLARFAVQGDALARLPHAMARRLGVLPLLLQESSLLVAMEDPTRSDVLGQVEFAAQRKVVPVIARAPHLQAAISRFYERVGAGLALPATAEDEPSEAPGDDAGMLLASLEQHSQAARGDDEPHIEQSDNSLVRLINQMILEAKAQGVSDIHIETQPPREKVRIRFRKDGLLRPYLDLPHTYRNALIARLKIMCDLDISERRKPQDGKINFARFVAGQRLELRLATIPTHSGMEDAVLRLLAAARPLPMAEIGLSAANLARLQELVQRPYGMLLCVGPTGSGKTTTLHSALAHINTPERKIWTAEDPIEITQAGLRQVQMNPKIDWSFAKALRALLRADPDVIMVGEIRDAETAQVAVEASLTGHLVLSTLHTNSAAETVTRLLDLGLEPFNFGDSLLGVLAQRLVRRLCSHCRSEREATPAQVDELLADHLQAYGDAPAPQPDAVLRGWRERFGHGGRLRHFHSAGCTHCDHSGLRGRAAVHELMAVSVRLRQLIQGRQRTELLRQQGLAEGMLTLRQDGIEKVLMGVAPLSEVRACSLQ